MKFLLDTSPTKLNAQMESSYDYLIGGQLLTPLTRYKNWGGAFAIDNGAFSKFDTNAFAALLEREEANKDKCVFVVCPDVVGDGRRTLELFARRARWIRGWPVALVAQDGIEQQMIPWEDFDCLFIGGGDPWKDSIVAQNLVKTALILGKHVHIGRVNGFERWRLFDQLGAHTCDGSGMARFSKENFPRLHVEIQKRKQPEQTLFTEEDHENEELLSIDDLSKMPG